MQMTASVSIAFCCFFISNSKVFNFDNTIKKSFVFFTHFFPLCCLVLSLLATRTFTDLLMYLLSQDNQADHIFYWFLILCSLETHKYKYNKPCMLTGETATDVPVRVPNIIVPIRSPRTSISPIVTITAQYHRSFLIALCFE